LYGAVVQTNGQTIQTNIPSPSLVCLADISLATTTHLQDLSGNLLSATLKEKQTKPRLEMYTSIWSTHIFQM
jgi:hypothetical protein